MSKQDFEEYKRELVEDKLRRFEDANGYCEIPLSKGHISLVDAQDYEAISKYKWTWINGYACRHDYSVKPYKAVYLHRVILSAPANMQVDHVNHDKLDNRRQNLRLATTQQNAFNRRLHSQNISGVSGVVWYKPYKKWRASISVDRKPKHIGYYAVLEDAITARLAAELKYYGKFRYNSSNKEYKRESRQPKFIAKTQPSQTNRHSSSLKGQEARRDK